ncbi:MAG TPA: PHB depolymerase family esterase [Acidimicrobiia bacterium]|nr:PHB depolymerase family esterase [Acidimicrobiia bacterium]
MGVKRAWIAVGGGVVVALVAITVGVAVGWHATAAPSAAPPPPAVPAPPAKTTASTSATPPSTKPPSRMPPAAKPAPAPPAPATTTPESVPGVPAGWVSTSVPVNEGSLARRYLLVRPATTSKTPLPVIVLLHGRIVTPEYEAQRTGLPAVTGPAILVYPAGYQNSWNAGACCAGAHQANVDDVGFVTEVVHQVLAGQRDADHQRVFLVGFSNGGKMAFRLTCAEPDLFDGVAVVAAVPVADCAKPPAVPSVQVAMNNDPLFTLTPDQPPKSVNGYVEQSTEGEVGALLAANGCQGSGQSQTLGTLTTTRWTSCGSGDPVELDLYQGDVHQWPAGDAATPPAQQMIWNFFRSIPEEHR